MARLFNYSTKQWEDHPDDDGVNAKIASGGYGLEAGLKIPVVNPNSGKIFELPTEEAAEAFKTGIRLATPDDLRARANIETQRVKEEVLNAPIQAAALGAARGLTFGASDAAARAIGGEKIGALLKDVKEANPYSSLGGEIAGAVLAPLPGAVEKTIAQGAKGIGAAVGAGVKGATGLTKAADIAARYSGKTLGSAAEGALYGLGSGVSEAALGDPQDIAEHLVHGASMGAIFGGTLGGAFEGARDTVPLFKEIGKASYSAAEAAFPKTAQLASDIAAKLISVPTSARDKMIDIYAGRVARKHGDEVASSVKDLLKNPTQTAEGLAQQPFANALEKEAGSLESAASSELAGAEQNLASTVARTPGRVVAEESAAGRQISQDLAGEINALNAKQQEGYQSFYRDLDKQYGALPGSELSRLSKEFEPLIAKLEKSKDTASQAYADSLRERLAAAGDRPSIADDVRALNDLKRDLFVSNPQKYTSADRKLISDMYAKTKESLDNYPVEEISTVMGNLNKMDTQRRDLIKVLGAKNDGSVPSKLSSLMVNPGQRDAFNAIVENIGDYAPKLRELQSKVANSADRRELLNDFRASLDMKKSAASGGKLSLDDITEVLGMFGKVKGDTEKFVERARDLQSVLKSTPGMGIADKFLQLKKAMGQSVDAELQKSLDKVRGLDKTIKNLDKLADIAVPPKEGMINVPNALAAFLAGPKGVAAVEGVRAIGRASTDPYKTVKNLVSIERAANRGARAVNDSITSVGRALTSDTARKGGVAYKVYGESLSDTRANLDKQREILTRMADKGQAVDYMINRIPPMVGAPLVQSAIMDQMMKTSEFLASKLPHDPFQGRFILGNNTNFIPSDAELSKYNRYLNAAQHPEMAIQSVARLSATPEEVETLRTLYPKTYERLQNEVVNAITKSGVTLSYPQRLTASQVLGQPMDASMDPAYIQSIQSRYQQQMPKDEGGRPPGAQTGKQIKIDIKPLETVQTPAQRVSTK